MMFDSCAQVKEELSALLDAQAESSRDAIELHMSGCQDCANEYASLKTVKDMVARAMDACKVDLESNMPGLDIWSSIQGRLPSVCEVIQEDLSAYLDGELTAPAKEGVNLHLKECEDCLGRFKLLNETNRILAKGLELPADKEVDIWSSVKVRLNKDCALIDNELSAYLDQEVATLRHREITRHLAECADCQSEFGKLTSVGDLIRDAYKPDIPQDFDLWPQIKSKLNVVQFTPKAETPTPVKAKPRGIDRRYYVGAAVAAVFVLVFGLGAFWLNTPGQSNIRQVSAESYLIESSLIEPANRAEAVVYEE